MANLASPEENERSVVAPRAAIVSPEMSEAVESSLYRLWLRDDLRIESTMSISPGARLLALVSVTDEDELNLLVPD